MEEVIGSIPTRPNRSLSTSNIPRWVIFTRWKSQIPNPTVSPRFYEEFAANEFGTKVACEAGQCCVFSFPHCEGIETIIRYLLYGSPIFDVLSLNMAARLFPSSLQRCTPFLFINKLFNST